MWVPEDTALILHGNARDDQPHSVHRQATDTLNLDFMLKSYMCF